MTTRHTGHTKRLGAPKKFPLLRKDKTYVVKMSAGPHGYTNGIPLLLVLREIMGHAKNQKEAKVLLINGKVLVDNVIRKNVRFPLGLMDTISIPTVHEYYRVIFETNGKIKLLKINEHESKIKLCKIMNKTITKKGMMQLNLHDGRNILINKGLYNTGYSIMIALPTQEIKKHILIEKGSKVYVMNGKHVGETAVLEEFKPQPGSQEERIIVLNEAGEKFETLKKYVLVL